MEKALEEGWIHITEQDHTFDRFCTFVIWKANEYQFGKMARPSKESMEWMVKVGYYINLDKWHLKGSQYKNTSQLPPEFYVLTPNSPFDRATRYFRDAPFKRFRVQVFTVLVECLASTILFEYEFLEKKLKSGGPLTKNNQPIFFITGPPHSGTTFVQNILGEYLVGSRSLFVGDVSSACPTKSFPEDKNERLECAKLRSATLDPFSYELEFYELIRAGGCQKRCLQVIVARDGRFPNTWVLKDPAHFTKLPCLFNAFPEARVICMSRKIEEIISSYIVKRDYLVDDLILKGGLAPNQVNKHFVNCMAMGLDEINVSRGMSLKHAHFCIDVDFKDLSDPLSCVKGICDKFGVCDAQRNDTLLLKWVEGNPRSSFDGDIPISKLGISADEVEHSFGHFRMIKGGGVIFQEKNAQCVEKTPT